MWGGGGGVNTQLIVKAHKGCATASGVSNSMAFWMQKISRRFIYITLFLSGYLWTKKQRIRSCPSVWRTSVPVSPQKYRICRQDPWSRRRVEWKRINAIAFFLVWTIWNLVFKYKLDMVVTWTRDFAWRLRYTIGCHLRACRNNCQSGKGYEGAGNFVARTPTIKATLPH
jgi:hypothetical protein